MMVKRMFRDYNGGCQATVREGVAEMKSESITIHIPSAMKERLEALAEALDRSKADLAARAIEAFVEDQEWQLKAIQEGLEAADRGEFASDDQVNATFRQWGVPADLRHAVYRTLQNG